MAAVDTFIQVNSANPATHAAAVTPSNSTVLPATRGLFVGGAGTIVATMDGNGASVTFTGVVAGSILPIRVTKVGADSTATNIVALW